MKLKIQDSGKEYLAHLKRVAESDVVGLTKAEESYGDSWKRRGGTGAFMMLARKWDRLENRVKQRPLIKAQAGAGETVTDALGDSYDIFQHILADQRSEGIIDDIRDLRRYLMLVEAEMLARGFEAEHRDNK